MNGFTSIYDSRVGVCVLKGSRTRTTLELAGPERFIFAEITIDLPSPQSAADVLPVVRSEDDAVDALSRIATLDRTRVRSTFERRRTLPV